MKYHFNGLTYKSAHILCVKEDKIQNAAHLQIIQTQHDANKLMWELQGISKWNGNQIKRQCYAKQNKINKSNVTWWQEDNSKWDAKKKKQE